MGKNYDAPKIKYGIIPLCFVNEKIELGLIAQLGERCVRNAEARGSSPLKSTNKKNRGLFLRFFLFDDWMGSNPKGRDCSEKARCAFEQGAVQAC